MKKDRDLAMKKKEELAAILMEAAKALKSSLMVGVCVCVCASLSLSHTHTHTHTHTQSLKSMCCHCVCFVRVPGKGSQVLPDGRCLCVHLTHSLVSICCHCVC